MKCLSLVSFSDQSPCPHEAVYRVSSTAGWSGSHCPDHALTVVANHLPQTLAHTMKVQGIR